MRGWNKLVAPWLARRIEWWLGLLLLAGAGCGATPERNEPPGGDTEIELIGVWYTVARGDSISAIGARHGVQPDDIIEINGVEDPDRLEVGQSLFLYGIEELLARTATDPESASSAPRPKPDQKRPRRTVSPKPSAPSRRPAKGRRKAPPRFVWPLTAGRLTSGYGKRGRRMHKGIDLAAKVGTPIFAAADGKVIYSDNKQRGYGNLVIIQHAQNFVTVYAHNRRNLVDEGDRVRQGTPIAELGNTGRSTGPHLHFEIRLKRKAVDPLIYLPAR